MAWNVASNWTLNADGSGPAASVPGQIDNVVILNGHTVEVGDIMDNGGPAQSADGLGLANVGAGGGGNTFPDSGTDNFFHNGDMTVQEGATLTFSTRVMFDGTIFIAGTLATNADIITLGNFYFATTATFSSLDDLICTGFSNTRIDNTSAFTNDDIYLDHTDAFVCGLGVLNIGQSGGPGRIINLNNGATVAQICTAVTISGCSPNPPGNCPPGTTVFSPTPAVLTGTGGSFAYTENDVVVIDAAIGLTYGEPFMTSATISVSGNYIDGEDELVLPPVSGILSNFDTGTGVLTLTGYGTIAQWEAALQTVTYENLSDNPTIVTRTITFEITDGFSTSNQISRNITIIPVNDPPDVSTVGGTPTPLAYTEGDGQVAADNQIELADPDDVNLEGATISLTNYVMGEDFLDFIDDFGVTKVDFNITTGILTLTGSALIADYESALRSVTYENTSEDPDNTTRMANFIVNDGDADSPPFSRDIEITPVNDAPTITGTVADLAYTEGDGAVLLDNGILVADVDNPNLSSATITISVNFQAAEDVLAYATMFGITGNFVGGVLTLTGSATVANYQTAIRSVTYANSSISPNTSTRTVSFVVNDGTDNSLAFNRDITIASVNSIPTISGTVADLAYTEGDGAVLLDNGILVADVDNTNLASATITISANFQVAEDVLAYATMFGITGNFVGGVMTLTGSATVANYQTAIRSITYTNSSISPNTSTRTVSFIVNDGTDNSLAFNRDITIASVNSVPTITGTVADLAYTEGIGPVLLDNAILVADLDNTSLTSATITISTNFQALEDVLAYATMFGITGNFVGGVMTLTGSATLANYQTAIRSITYENTSISPNTSDRTVSFIVNDGTDNSLTFTRDITIASVNSVPTITGTVADLAYTEGIGPVLLDNAILVADIDNTNLASATITISTNFQALEDVLAYATMFGITGNFVGGVLTLTGSATVANYQTAIRSITYENTSISPNTSDRTVSFIVNDGTDNSLTFNRDITIASVNSVPTITGTVADLAYTEGTGAVLLDNGILVSDLDDASLASATITFTINFQAAEDVLAYSTMFGITGIYAGGVMTLSGSASLADYQTAIRSITYENTSEDPNAATRTVSFVVNDGTDNSMAFNRDITITTVNSAPIITGTVADLAYTEGDGAVLLDNGILVADVDNTNLASATITISANFQVAEDVLAYATMFGITGNFVGGVMTLTGSATVANYQTAIRSVTYTNSSISPNTSTRTVSFIVNDGTDNSIAFNRDITITTVNSAPTITGTVADLAYTEGDGAVLLDNGILVADVDNTNLASATITFTINFQAAEDVFSYSTIFGITGNFAGGVMTLSGSASLADYQTAIRSITYENTSEDPNAATRTVSFVVNDGTDNSMAFMRDITITPVNDQPGVAGSVADLNYTEGDGAVIFDNALLVSDVDNINLASATINFTANFLSTEDVLGFTNQNGITGNFTAGTLSLTGTASLIDYQEALQSITYENSSENPNTAVRSLEVIINDGALASIAFNRNINLIATNDLPTISGSTTDLNYNEGQGALEIDDMIAVSDIDNLNFVSATIEITSNFTSAEDLLGFTDQNGISGNYLNGILLLTGSASLPNYQTAIRSVTYTNTSATPNTNTRTVSFIVNDGTDNSLPFSRDILIIPIVEPPVITVPGGGSSATLTYTEGDGQVAIEAGFNASDPDDTNFEGATLSITGNYLNGEDILAFVDQSGITGTFDAASGSIVLQGTATISDYQTAVRTITYENTSEAPSNMVRTAILNVDDGDGISNNITITINVIPVNDAPEISGTATALNYPESSGPVAIDDALLASDIDNTELASATITINNNYQPGEDILSYTDQLGIAGQFDENTGVLTLSGQALLSDYQTALRSITYENNNDLTDLQVRLVEITINDGDLESNIFSREIVIEEVDDPVIVYEVVTPDGDSMNDTWIIDGIGQFPNNTVSLFNRWNSLVYQQQSYDNQITAWSGDANEGFSSGALPDGTYFYTVDLGDGSKIREGFLVLKRK